ncbi:hypothetical protein [Alloactinosynnema sp. L-07]|uniref:hypothetical protein n=1 Tax=Alloactinosynnema sp. L-07 TaxID=1653480 RepID=UPI0012F9A020|nr:hypothetical protein [Alloactinosynnema sp. L-07]
MTLPPDIAELSHSLLEWLYDHYDDGADTPGVGEFFESRAAARAELGYLLVQYLASRDLVKDWSTLGGPDARITARGLDLVQQIRAQRAGDPGERTRALRRIMLRWLDDHERRAETVTNWDDFLVSPSARHNGVTFGLIDVAREADYLVRVGLISGGSHQSGPGMLRPRLTHNGRDCVTDFGGAVAEYLRAVNAGGTVNVAVNGDRPQVAVGQNIAQNRNDSVVMPQYEPLANALREILGKVSGWELDDDDKSDVKAIAGELLDEVARDEPDEGAIRRNVRAIGRILNSIAMNPDVQTALAGLVVA